MNRLVNKPIYKIFNKIYINKNINNQLIKYFSVNHDSHHDNHKPASPYDVPHEHFNDKEAYFGATPDNSKFEGWEIPTFATTLACILVLIGGPALFDTTNHDDFKGWARREAIARLKAKESGKEIEFGKYYSGHSYTQEEIDVAPVVADDE